MSKERFILCNKITDSNVWDTSDKQCYSWEYVVYLLNEYSNENEKLKKEIGYWKKWALEYLIDYPLYTDEFLDTLKEINGEKFDVEKTRKKQNEIIKILKNENLW